MLYLEYQIWDQMIDLPVILRCKYSFENILMEDYSFFEIKVNDLSLQNNLRY